MLSDRLSRWLAGGAACSLILMLGITICDVLMRNLFNHPILGTTEVVQVTLVYVVFLGIPEIFLHRSHVTVDVIDHLVGRRAVYWLDLAGGVACLALLAVMLWMLWGSARDAYAMGDRTSDLGIPLTVFWAPILLGGACSILAMLLFLWRELRRLAG
jgi:TRAP-type transport system small permease protein